MRFFSHATLAMLLFSSLAGTLPTTGKSEALGNKNGDFNELQKYAHLSSVAYCLKKGLGKGPLGEQGEKCPANSCTDESISDMKVAKTFNFNNWFMVGSGFIAVDPATKSIYLVFRGTASVQDWMNNLNALPVNYQPLVVGWEKFHVKSSKCKDCKMHKGFHNFIKTNGEQIVKEVVKWKEMHSDYRIVVTGHSLGAALAIVTGVELRLLGHETLVVTLAGPKVGNENFKNFVDDLFDTDEVQEHIEEEHSFDTLCTGFIRMVHRHDIIPLLPPSSLYKHSGYEYFLSKAGAPQTPKTVERRGTDYIEESEDLEYLAMLPTGFSRADHTEYFFKITGCQP